MQLPSSTVGTIAEATTTNSEDDSSYASQPIHSSNEDSQKSEDNINVMSSEHFAALFFTLIFSKLTNPVEPCHSIVS